MPPRCGRLEPMSHSAVPPPPRTDIGVQVGLVVAAAQVPGTFAPGLTPRSDVDQGLTTALSTGLHYLLALGTQDALQAAAAELARTPLAARWSDPVTRARVLTLAADLAAVPWASPSNEPSPTARARRWREARPGRPDGARHPRASPRSRSRPRAPGSASSTTGWMPGAGSRGCRSRCRSGWRSRSPWTDGVGCPPTTARRTRSGRPGALAPRGRGSGGWPRGRGLRRAPPRGGGRPAARRPRCRAARRSGAWPRTRHPWVSSRRGRRWCGRARCGPSRPGRRPRTRARWRRVDPLARADPERFPGEPGAVGHARQGGPAPHDHLRAPGPAARPAGRGARPVDRDGDGRAGRGGPGAGVRRARQCADDAGARRAGARRDGAHRRVRPLAARARLADRPGLRQLRRDGGGAVPHAR